MGVSTMPGIILSAIPACITCFDLQRINVCCKREALEDL